jgi:hypothetical protein
MHSRQSIHIKTANVTDQSAGQAMKLKMSVVKNPFFGKILIPSDTGLLNVRLKKT